MRLVLGVVSAALALSAGGATGAEPKPLLVFSAARNGDGFTFYTARSDRSDRRLIGASWSEAYEDAFTVAAWSPDGRRLALTGYSYYAIVSAEGRSIRVLRGAGATQYETAISWSPEGRLLAVDGQVVDAATGRRVTRLSGGTPSFSRDGRLVAFYGQEGEDGSDGGLWVQPPRGGKARYLTPALGQTESHDASPPTWSRDSRRIAYSFGGRIYVYDLSRGRRTALLRTPGRPQTEPVWSPDGRWIAFVRGAPPDSSDTRTAVGIVRPDGSGLRILTNLPFVESTPTWSPDSRRLAFLADYRRTEQGARRAYVVSIAGGPPRRIIRPLCGKPEQLAALAWGPRGRLVYASSLVGYGRGSLSGNDTQIYAARTDGSDARRFPGSCADERAPAWSPDGRRIAYGSGPYLHVISADGSGDRRLTTGGAPDWSPDGSTIVFSRPKDQVYVIGAAGGVPRQLTTEGTNEQPAWSSTAGRIAFTSTRDGRPEVYTMRPDGSDQQRVTRLGGSDPSWSPDGRRLTYLFEHGVWTIAVDGSDPRELVHRFDQFDVLEDPEWAPDGATIAFGLWSDGADVGSIAFVPAGGGREEWMPYNPLVGATGYENYGAPSYSEPDWYPWS
ncbi:MAG: hypothetical protein ABR521_07825 [Gaiellaceae bacterium]